MILCTEKKILQKRNSEINVQHYGHMTMEFGEKHKTRLMELTSLT
jgi:hypothetical protein